MSELSCAPNRGVSTSVINNAHIPIVCINGQPLINCAYKQEVIIRDEFGVPCYSIPPATAVARFDAVEHIKEIADGIKVHQTELIGPYNLPKDGPCLVTPEFLAQFTAWANSATRWGANPSMLFCLAETLPSNGQIILAKGDLRQGAPIATLASPEATRLNPPPCGNCTGNKLRAYAYMIGLEDPSLT